jgi:hypothetical protein
MRAGIGQCVGLLESVHKLKHQRGGGREAAAACRGNGSGGGAPGPALPPPLTGYAWSNDVFNEIEVHRSGVEHAPGQRWLQAPCAVLSARRTRSWQSAPTVCAEPSRATLDALSVDGVPPGPSGRWDKLG